MLRLDELPPLLDLELLDLGVLLERLGLGRRHADEDELLRAHRHRRPARLVPAPPSLHKERRLLRLSALATLREQPSLAVLIPADFLHKLGARAPLPTTLVQLHHADRRLERHRVEAARRPWRWLGLNASLLEQHLEVLFALGQEVRLVLEEEFRDGHLEHVGRQLQIDEHVVEVDEIDLLESDELLLHFKQATHDTLKSLAHVHALLRVHGLVVALLELAENLQVADV